MTVYLFDPAMWRRWWQKYRQPEPKQLELDFSPFAGVPYCGGVGYCVYRNDRDERYPGSGFYGDCWVCGETYDPGCDR